MKQTSAYYEHSTTGFPGIKLKWGVQNGTTEAQAYITVKGVIREIGWTWERRYPMPFIEAELTRFDTWVRDAYSEDSSVQG
jgi:hypothetical protein